jgi:ribonuclease-3
MAELSELELAVDISFTNKDLLQQVFVHRSYLNEHRGFALGHNERLEFLGDAVLELVVTEHLYNNFPNPEGELTSWRSSLVKGETLAVVALELNFPEYLMLSYGEAKSGGKNKNFLLANAFEAFIGALYLDKGYDACASFIGKYIISRLAHILENQLFVDPKSRLQEYTQQHFGQTPSYMVIDEEGPDHAKTFTVEARIGERVIGKGTGNSKQGAQVSAAQSALDTLITAN